MASRRAWCLVAGVVLAWGSAAEAQKARPAPPDAKRQAEEKPDPEPGVDENAASKSEEKPAPARPALFGDPKKFTPTSGWGGMGASMGQLGFARSMLIALPAVQKDLELTDEQKEHLKEWGEAMRTRGEEMTKGMREQAREQMTAGRFALDLPAMLGTMQGLMRENETGFGAILTPGQRKRLDQIAWQMEGITALARPELAEAVKLHEHQVDRIQQILAQSRTRQVMYWMNQTRLMWMERSRAMNARPGAAATAEKDAKPATEEAAPAPAEDDLDDERASAAKKAQREKQVKEQTERFEKMRTGSDEIQDQSVREILKVLTPRQKRRYEGLLGEPFDPERVTEGMRRPGRGEEAGELAPRGEVAPQ